MNLEGRRTRRVAASHQIASAAFRLTGLFVLGAMVWAAVVLFRGGPWWGPLHTFLLGGVTLAIAGAAQMFTVTWSAAPAPPAVMAAVQRWGHAIGAGLVLIGVTGRLRGLTVIGGVLVGVGMVVLALNLVGAVRHSLLRRFDLSARFYLLAIGCALVGVTLGVLLSTGSVGSQYTRVRLVHGHLNLIGFIGFTIVGTLPTILPTFAHHRAVSGREAVWAWRVAIAAAVLLTAGLGFGEWAVAIGTILSGLALALIGGGVIVRLGAKGARGGLPYLQVVAGSTWLVGWTAVEGARLLRSDIAPAFDAWILAAAVVGIGQVLLGSLAYLLPVLAGPADLGRNFARFGGHPWIPLVAANLAGAALVAGSWAGAALLVVWLFDFIRRLVDRSSAGSP